MEVNREFSSVSPKFLLSVRFWNCIRNEKSVSSNGVSHITAASCRHRVEVCVAKLILQNRRDGIISMADRGCTPVFQDFTRGRSRVVECQWHCAAIVVMHRRNCCLFFMEGLS